MDKRQAIIDRLKKTLSEKRFKHCLRVEKISLTLAQKHNAPLNQASLAALLHDNARRYKREQLLYQAKKHGLKISPSEKLEPKLVHSKLGALLAKKEFKIKSPSILRAIANHTLGRPGMSKLEKIIYLADHVEEGRKRAGLKTIRQLASKNLDLAVIKISTSMIEYLLRRNLPIDPGTIKTRNYYLQKV